MPLTSRRTGQFKRDYKLMRRRGKDMGKLREVMRKLVERQPLDRKHHDHPLAGGYTGRRDCHIEPDWILIYKLGAGTILFERTGTHADLFE